MSKKLFARRKQARFRAVQAVYQWHLSHNDLNEIFAAEITMPHAHKMDQAYFKQLFFGVCEASDTLDQQFKPYLDRGLHEVAPIELVILRISTYELSHFTEIPYRVIINEAVELAKTFGGTDGHKFINGVLDRLVKHTRASEMNQ